MSTVRVYRGDIFRDIPAIDYTPAWEAQGWSSTPQKEPPISETLPLPFTDLPTLEHPALTAINQAMDPDDIVELPSIGKVRAAAIIKNRPEGGYTSLDHAENLNPSGTDWEAVALWEG